MKKNRKILFGWVWFSMVLLTYGCQTVPPIKTPTGKPEVVIKNQNKKFVVDHLTNEMLSRGYQIRKIDDYTAIFGRAVKNSFSAALYGSSFNSTPEARVSYNIVKINKNIRIIATLEVVTNPGSGFEKTTDFSKSKEGHKIYKFLRRIKREVENINK